MPTTRRRAIVAPRSSRFSDSRDRKSHLARVLGTEIGDEARVLLGRCLSYGEGSTVAPLAEIVRDVAGDEPEDALRELLARDGDRDVIAEHITTAIGLSESGGGSETTFWAVRKLFEALAHERPLVLVFDDLHWAEPSFLDLVEYVVDWTVDAPILMLGLARPELLDERPAWAGGKRNATSILLKPLTDGESEALIDNLLAGAGLDPKRRTRIVEAAGGNPFFAEQMLAMDVARDGSDDVRSSAVPPTIQALLAARFDRLDPEQRTVLEHASIMGKEFWRGALVELAPSQARDSIGESLRALVREQLIEPCRSALPIGDGLRFNSTLIRDTVYESVPKRSRAVLHEAVARWFGSTVGDIVSQYEEVLGYHFEQAFVTGRSSDRSTTTRVRWAARARSILRPPAAARSVAETCWPRCAASPSGRADTGRRPRSPRSAPDPRRSAARDRRVRCRPGRARRDDRGGRCERRLVPWGDGAAGAGAR